MILECLPAPVVKRSPKDSKRTTTSKMPNAFEELPKNCKVKFFAFLLLFEVKNKLDNYFSCPCDKNYVLLLDFIMSVDFMTLPFFAGSREVDWLVESKLHTISSILTRIETTNMF